MRNNELLLNFKSNWRFLDSLDQTVHMSDKLGFVYWFAVLTTISCGCATGIFVTIQNKSDMVKGCQQKYKAYEDFLWSKHIDVSTANSSKGSHHREKLNGHDEILDIQTRIEYFDLKLR